ncbi:hypothetical protein DPMN_116222 [Dreissena polymorpha]|uniref:Lysosomal Pro-X carboxypeptidase n=2 Tax=Dreissena polymorpha TaxID=45954 RepID=A0A9D4KNF7_DREPO|nr:hypothetical protein DPMN_116222 [Dreissena polymorpha]
MLCGVYGRMSIIPKSFKNKNTASDYEYKTEYFVQQIDHFGFANLDTYKQRYLIADQYWNANGGPIFFYTGNEGDITWFCNNTGFMWDIAAEFKALLVFAEHRYYGESLPYGPDTFKSHTHLNYLTSEQALADFAVLIGQLKRSLPGAANSSVVAFGGSYGGMLSAWMRIKYPNVIVGALAASAPIWQFTGITPCEAFNQVLTNAFKQASQICVENVRNSWATITSIGGTTSGRKFLSSVFNLCKPMSHQSDVDDLKAWLTDAWTDLAMVNYPYPANFLENLPAWPVKAVCNKLSLPAEGEALVQYVADAANIYFNYTGDSTCLNTSQQATGNLGDLGWGYQSCTEMVMPMCADGESDMFEPKSWNFTDFSEQCYKQWKTRPQENWITTEYWGKQLQYASNIIFSNGLLDPWSSGGVLESPALTLIPIVIPDGAHHLDLRASNPLDTAAVVAARIQEKNLIKMWLGQL